MVSFSCEACGDVLTKKKLDPHRNQCRGASYTCIDCMVHFQGTEYRAHTSCISEAQKYQGHLYKDKKANKSEKRKSLGEDMVPKKAYFEDAPEEGDNAIAIVEAPPRAPTPPPANEALPPNINVFDYLVTDDTPSHGRSQVVDENRMITDSQLSNGDGKRFKGQGFSYGNAPVEPTFERYDSWSQFPDREDVPVQPPAPAQPAYFTKIITPGPDIVTPAPGRRTKDDKSDKKRKRHMVDDLDLSVMKRPSSRDGPMTEAPGRLLHTGLTGGLTRLVTDSSFYEDRIDAGPTPISPIKRSKHNGESKRHSSYGSTRVSTTSRRDDRKGDYEYYEERRTSRRHRSPSSSEDDRRRHSKVKAIDFQPHGSRGSSVQPTATNQLVRYNSRADLFLSFVTKGPDSERGCSINKALKRYHRERDTHGDEKDEDDKELWKSLRLRKNDRGEIVLFVA